jgi:type IX secretion system PorP/SprF family membrane protein
MFGRLHAQMYPWFTQYRSNMYLYNPAFCGTKRFFDFRMFYRNQWDGFPGAPKTYAASLNMRLAKGKVGLGGFAFSDQIGPFKTTYAGGTFAYHLRFDDVELSFGIQGIYMNQTFDGSKVTLHNSVDRAIDVTSSSTIKGNDGSAGLVLLNDRFYIALGVNNLIGKEMIYYQNDPSHLGKYKNEPTITAGAAFNYAENKDYTFENSIMVLHTSGVPMYFDYTLRLHIKQLLLTGISVRLKDAIAIHLGVNLKNQVQIAYSYDIVTSPLRKYNSNSHEISFVFSSNMGRDQKKKGFNNRFLKQKFQYLL